MADIKFHCPECEQKILVDDSAAGMQIDCPSCRSALLIPAEAGVTAQLVTRRRQAVGAGGGGSAYEELDRKQRELTAALEEAAKLRTESEKSKTEVNRLRDDLAATARERDGLRATGLEFNRLKGGRGSLSDRAGKDARRAHARAAGAGEPRQPARRAEV